MPKRKPKGKSERVSRLKNRQRMRDARQRQQIPVGASEQPLENSATSCGVVDGAVSAPLGNLPGQVSMGFPLKEEKPLARMQASLRERMHPNALSSASSQGSRLCAQSGGMAPSPDSPPWVCTSPRVPEPDTVHVSGSAGQAQLDMSSSFSGDESSRIQIDAPRNLTRTKKYTERKLYDDTVYMRNECDDDDDDDDDDDETNNNSMSTTNGVCFSVQASYHQADIIFGENAGTQCVANCLAAVAFQKIKDTKWWDRKDMNTVLSTGNELYSYLQRSSTIVSRYLLVHELPQFFECFSQTFEFKANESIPSLINLSRDEPQYEDFNAYPLIEGLQIALADTDGCFVCFGGNTFLIGKTNEKYFTFDSHSRSFEGYLCESGKSTRVLYRTIHELFNHVVTLARSMGYSETVQCEITGVHCSLIQFQSREISLQRQQHRESVSVMENANATEVHVGENCNATPNTHLSRHDDVEYVCSENNGFNFMPLSGVKKRQLCESFGIFCSFVDNSENVAAEILNMEKPVEVKDIDQDGNCLFKAISFSLTESQDFHMVIRSAVCHHLLQNQFCFKPFLRHEETSVENHISNTHMNENGKWATEIEILGLSHLLKTDIYTYSDNRWVLFSGRMVDQDLDIGESGSIYLHHKNQNHYDVVTMVSSSSTNLQHQHLAPNFEVKYNKRLSNRERMRAKRNIFNKMQSEDLLAKKKVRYINDETFRSKVKETSKERYLNDEHYKTNLKQKSVQKYALDPEHRMTVKQKSIAKYQTNESHREDVKSRSKIKYRADITHKEKVKRMSTQKYKLDDMHKEKVKRQSAEKYKVDEIRRRNVKNRSTEKYKSDEMHRENVKSRSTEKYKSDEMHRQNVKNRSTEKYKSDEMHRQNVKNRSTEKYKSDEMHRQNVKNRSTEKYKLDELHKQNVKKRSTEKYKLDEDHRKKVKVASKASYHLSSEAKRLKKDKVSKKRQERREKLKGEGEVVNFFRNMIKQGPEYTCCCCHRLLFENQVRGCTHEMYTMNHQARNVADLCIGDKYVHQCGASCTDYCPRSTMWVCFTCHRKIMSGKIPQEAAINKMSLEEIPLELSDLNSLEQHLIALHIPFMKVMSLPQGGQRNVHGPVVCVPSNIKKTTSLPLNNDENLLLRVKLKRKLSYKGYFEYQFVNPRHIKAALEFLKENNKWYQDVSINSNWTENDDHCLISDTIDNNESNQEMPEIEINHNQEVATDTCLQPVDIAQEVLDHYFDDVFNIAPGEGQNPVRMLQEKGNEAKSFPHLFPSGRFTWNEDRDERITLSRYFNNRLMNTDNRFAKDTNYIFFAQFMSELKQVIEKTQISIRKSLSKGSDGKLVTSDMLQDPNILSKLIKNDEALRFMQPIRGTPAYWSTTQKDLFAMLRQLGIPTWFCSFSAAEFRWNEIVGCILHHEHDNRNPSDLDWSEKSEILRRNPVTVARMFEHRFHVFQREVILSPANPIGNVVDYFIRVEFQQRGSPHMHCLYWVEDAPKFGEDSEKHVCDFIDKYVSCSLPSEDDEQDLRQAVLSVQQHSKNHSKSCRKKGTECRFNFPRPPSERTFIAEQCEEDAETLQTNMQMNTSQAKDTLLKVWNKVLDDNSETQTTEEIFADLSLSQEDYEKAHRVLTSRTTTILKRDPKEMWTNQYNECLLKCWDANMDIQYVLDPFSCIVYIISYISKAEREMGMLLKQTKIEATEGNLSAKQTMKKIGSAYLNHREVSAQEAVYRVCNLKMKECSRKVVFIPVGENPTRLSKPLSQLNRKRKPQSDECEGDDDEEDIWMTNIVERYENRPQTDYFNQMCLAEFCSEFRVLAKSQVPQGEKEGVYELRNGKGYIQKRTRGKPAVIRYPRFNTESAPEKYFQSILQLFLPYINQRQLKPPGFDLYESFYSNGFVRVDTDLQAVKDVVNEHRNQFSKDEEAIENAAEIFEMIGEPEDAWASLCPETEMKREECLIQKSILDSEDTQLKEVTEEVEREDSSDVIYHIREASNSRQEMLPLLQSLNDKQKEVFYSVREWCLKKISQENPEPLHIFITGGAGTGKSHLIKAIHFEASRLLGKTLPIPNAISILLTAFTGTAAFNIGGNTIHHVFSLSKALPIPYEPLKEQTLNAMRSKLENVQILIIDEVSMVFKRLMYYIHERLVQIKKCKQPFGGISVIAVGDFYQLPPVKQRKDERLYKVNDTYPVDYWLDFFKIIELDEIMRQREDVEFAAVLNYFRVRTIDEQISNEALTVLRDCIREGPDDALHVYSTNVEVNDFNLEKLQTCCANFIEVDAEDYQKDKATGRLKLREKPLITTKTDGLSSSLLLAVNARVMLTRNVSVEDGLVNGAMGYISHFEFGRDHHVQRKNIQGVGVIFDSKEIGKVHGTMTQHGNQIVIKRIQEEIKEKNTKNVVRHQFPLKLSWACTAHKVQGMTTDKVVVNLDRTFAAGQAYVAISRVTSKDGLYIETADEDKLKKKIYADPDVKTSLSIMQKFVPSGVGEMEQIQTEECKTILLLNVQSLRAHIQDIKSDNRLTNSDLMCLTETWLKNQEDLSEFEIPGFNFHSISRGMCYDESSNTFRKLIQARGGGVGVFQRKEENINVHELPLRNIEGMALELCKQNIVIIVIYRPGNINVGFFLDALHNIIIVYQEHGFQCVVVGDFNEDARSKGPITSYLQSKGFEQKVEFSTTEGGTILDHIYVTEGMSVKVVKVPVYFSYHDAIKVYLQGIT